MLTLLRIVALNIAVSQATFAMTCNIAVKERVACGYSLISQDNCESIGCCYDGRANSCFMKLAERSNPEYPTTNDPHGAGENICKFIHNRKITCGYRGISKLNCQQRGCCWKRERNIWISSCYLPQTLSATRGNRLTATFLGFPRNISVSHPPTQGPKYATSTTVSTYPEQNSTDNILSLLESLNIEFIPDVIPETTDESTTENSSLDDSNTKQNTSDVEETFVLPDLLVSANMSSEGGLTIKTLLRMLMQLHEFNTTDKLESCSKINPISCCKTDSSMPCCEFVKENNEPKRIPHPRIVGGGPASYLKKSMAYLTKSNYKSQFCGGTLINNGWVITAAHCVLEYCGQERSPGDIVVKFGKTDKSNYVWEKRQVQIRRVYTVICHKYNCKSRNNPRLNDVALLQLTRPVRFSPYVTPALLPKLGETPSDDSDCTILGWGETMRTRFSNQLKQVTVPYLTNEVCNLPKYRNCGIRACMMCAGAYMKDPCEGDSGGPLFCPNSSGTQVFHGVYSWGRCGSESFKPAVYSRISYYKEWIMQNINATLSKQS